MWHCLHPLGRNHFFDVLREILIESRRSKSIEAREITNIKYISINLKEKNRIGGQLSDSIQVIFRSIPLTLVNQNVHLFFSWISRHLQTALFDTDDKSRSALFLFNSIVFTGLQLVRAIYYCGSCVSFLVARQVRHEARKCVFASNMLFQAHTICCSQVSPNLSLISD